MPKPHSQSDKAGIQALSAHVCDGADPAAPVIVTKQLGMTFPGGVEATKSIDMKVFPKDFLVILGPSGAGKSTLLRSLNRLNHPTAGQVLLRDKDITHVSGRKLRRVRQQVGMIFQQFNLVGRLSVIDNVLSGRLGRRSGLISYVLSHVRWFKTSDRDAAMRALQHVGIADKAYQRAETLSGGQQQRVAIARLLVQEPQIILADEPIASLDPASAAAVMDTLQAINREQGIPVVVNLHQVEVAKRYATRIVGMRAGRVLFECSADEMDHDVEKRLYHKTPNDGGNGPANQAKYPLAEKQGTATSPAAVS